MKVRVIETTQDASGFFNVAFDTGIGTIKARWIDNKRTPIIGKEYDVELDINETADIQTNTCIIDKCISLFLCEGDLIKIQGPVEDVEDDGLAYLRLATDCLVMIDTDGGISSGNFIQITLPISAISITVTGE